MTVVRRARAGVRKPPREETRISVFDSDVAGLYVDAERNIEFLPFELALLSNLADALRTLDGQLQGRRSAVEQGA